MLDGHPPLWLNRFMPWLAKHPKSIRSASGWEWVIWKKLPLIWLVGTVLPGLLGLAAWLGAPASVDGAHDPAMLRFEFVMLGTVILHWTLVLTLAIGCAIVMLMKGPTYVADSYPLSDSDRPL